MPFVNTPPGRQLDPLTNTYRQKPVLEPFNVNNFVYPFGVGGILNKVVSPLCQRTVNPNTKSRGSFSPS